MEKILLSYIVENCIGNYPKPQLETAGKGLAIASKLIETQSLKKQLECISLTTSIYLHDVSLESLEAKYTSVKKEFIKVSYCLKIRFFCAWLTQLVDFTLFVNASKIISFCWLCQVYKSKHRIGRKCGKKA